MSRTVDVLVIGAGAAGMMCAIEAGRRGRRVLVVDHARAPGEKIRISGGGRCNFTNLATAPERFISQNPRFCASALSRYGPERFVALVDRHAIAWHEKTAGQLFCDGSARQIVDMLLSELRQAGAELALGQSVEAAIARDGETFVVQLEPMGEVRAGSVVVACGGLSIPKMGATGLGYEIARRFGLDVTPLQPGLVPLTLTGEPLARWSALAGVSLPVRASAQRRAFEEAMLFTHRGLSGPAILQLSSYLPLGGGPVGEVEIDLAPGAEVFERLRAARATSPRQSLLAALGELTPRRLAADLAAEAGAVALAELSDKRLRQIADLVNRLRLRPAGSEGYRTAEVTVGGVDTRGLDQRTMQARQVPGLYFIGELVDVTGWLGGYNFQWAWASGWCAGQAV